MSLAWTDLAAIPDEVAPANNYWDSSTLVGYAGKLYAYNIDQLCIYDVASDTWSAGTIPDISMIGNAAAVVVDGVIWYVNYQGYVQTYTIATGEWSDMVNWPGDGATSGRGVPSASHIAGKIYLYVRGAFLAFDIETQTRTLTSFSRGNTTYRSSVTDGTKLYGVEGYQGNWSDVGLQPSSQSDTGVLETYNPSTDTWTYSENPDPQYRNDHVAVFHGGNIYAICGGSDDNNYPGGYSVPWVSVYNISGDSWTVDTDLAIPRADAVACVLNDKIYVLGGYSNGGAEPDPEHSLVVAALAGGGDDGGGGGGPPVLIDPDLRLGSDVAPRNVHYMPVR